MYPLGLGELRKVSVKVSIAEEWGMQAYNIK